MRIVFPKSDAKYHWTNHVKRKMAFYGLSPSRVLRVMRAPKRMEKGIAEGTLAGMQPAGTQKRPTEIWVMWAEPRSGSKSKGKSQMSKVLLSKKVIITAWRYPGISPIREAVPIPANIVAELREEGALD